MHIAYFPMGDKRTASSRLRVWKIAEVLERQGHTVTLNGDPFAADVVVVQKRFDLQGIMQQCRQKGIGVIWDVDDYMANGPAELADVVTVDTPAKLSLYPNAVVIPDALDIEADAPRKAAHAEHLSKVVTVCNAENVYHLRNAATACDKLKLELTVITDLTSERYAHIYGVTGFQWDVSTVDRELIHHDLFIAPYVFDGQWGEAWVKSKSPNRILKAYALGLPVAATPIPAYKEIGLVYQAETAQEWVRELQLLDDCRRRQADATYGLACAQEFSAERVARQWMDVFSRADND